MIIFCTFIGEIDRGNCLSNGYTPALLSFFLVYNINGEIMKRIKYERGQLLGQCIYLNDTEDIYYNNNKSKPVRAALFQCTKCEDRNTFTTSIKSITQERTISCGCAKIKAAKEILKTHGLSYHPLHRRWGQIKARCYYKSADSYKNYGGRGIIMCDEWLIDFIAFYNYIILLPDYDLNLTIDRINNDGNYEPGNIRFASKHEQVLNSRKRKSKSKYTGVYYRAIEKRYSAHIGVYGKKIYIGVFDSITDAIDARNQHIIDNNLIGYKIQEYDQTSGNNTSDV